ncbi:MAG: GNAT family N-acetyltransferase [Tenuifilaceae bacterium]
MKFNKLDVTDLPKIKDLQPEGWTDITPEFEFYLKSNFCNPIKIEVDGRMVGVGVSIVYEKTAWLAHIIVDSSFRNRGVGSKIVEELMNNLRSESITTYSLIATEIGQPVYVRAGFRFVSNYVFMKREKPWINYPVSSKIVNFHEDYRSTFYDLDKQITGENRIPLLNEFIKTSLLFIDKNEVLGYFMPDLKEGLIYAETDEAGLELMKLKYSKVDKAVLPSENIVGVEFLKNNGFFETSTKGTRMILGKDLDWKPTKMYSRIGGNFG